MHAMALTTRGAPVFANGTCRCAAGCQLADLDYRADRQRISLRALATELREGGIEVSYSRMEFVHREGLVLKKACFS